MEVLSFYSAWPFPPPGGVPAPPAAPPLTCASLHLAPPPEEDIGDQGNFGGSPVATGESLGGCRGRDNQTFGMVGEDRSAGQDEGAQERPPGTLEKNSGKPGHQQQREWWVGVGYPKQGSGIGDALGLALGQMDWDFCNTWNFRAQLCLAPVDTWHLSRRGGQVCVRSGVNREQGPSRGLAWRIQGARPFLLSP